MGCPVPAGSGFQVVNPAISVKKPAPTRIQDAVSREFHPSLADRAKLSTSFISFQTCDSNSFGHFAANSGDNSFVILSSAPFLALLRFVWIFSSIRIGASNP